MITERLTLTALALIAALSLTGCAARPAAPEGSHPDGHAAAPTGEPTDAPDAPEPAVQAASCEWDLERRHAEPVTPDGTGGDLATVLVGSWQHTHSDTGSGFEPVDHDIRFVFPAPVQLIYCQHVPGITEHAERAAAITLDGTDLVLPDPAPGYRVLAWDQNSMLWLNKMDGSTYLLTRR